MKTSWNVHWQHPAAIQHLCDRLIFSRLPASERSSSDTANAMNATQEARVHPFTASIENGFNGIGSEPGRSRWWCSTLTSCIINEGSKSKQINILQVWCFPMALQKELQTSWNGAMRRRMKSFSWSNAIWNQFAIVHWWPQSNTHGPILAPGWCNDPQSSTMPNFNWNGFQIHLMEVGEACLSPLSWPHSTGPLSQLLASVSSPHPQSPLPTELLLPLGSSAEPQSPSSLAPPSSSPLPDVAQTHFVGHLSQPPAAGGGTGAGEGLGAGCQASWLHVHRHCPVTVFRLEGTRKVAHGKWMMEAIFLIWGSKMESTGLLGLLLGG